MNLVFRIVLLAGEWIAGTIFVLSCAATWTGPTSYFVPAAIGLTVGLTCRMVARDLCFDRRVHRIVTSLPDGGHS